MILAAWSTVLLNSGASPKSSGANTQKERQLTQENYFIINYYNYWFDCCLKLTYNTKFFWVVWSFVKFWDMWKLHKKNQLSIWMCWSVT